MLKLIQMLVRTLGELIFIEQVCYFLARGCSLSHVGLRKVL